MSLSEGILLEVGGFFGGCSIFWDWATTALSWKKWCTTTDILIIYYIIYIYDPALLFYIGIGNGTKIHVNSESMHLPVKL